MTLEIQQGVTAVIGPSGAGKTSLLNLLVGYERPSAGRIVLKETTSDNPLTVFWAPPHQGLWPHLTVREHLTTVSPDMAAIDVHANALLTKFDLQDQASAKPDTLSLGERSRLNVARAIASAAEVLVLDEPLAHVDPAHVGNYWDVIRETCSQSGCSLVFSTHTPEVVLREADRVICLARGSISYHGTVIDLYERPDSLALATLLGPCNWLTSDEAAAWFLPRPAHLAKAEDSSVPMSPCIRPERLSVEPALENSPIFVESTRFAGTSTEFHLRDERSGNGRRFVGRPADPTRFQSGQRVILKLLLLLLCLGVVGCYGSSEPVISVTRESNWLMPPDGPRVPAPRGMTVTADDQYLVLDNVGRVLVYNESGEVVRQWWMPEYSIGKAEGICKLKDGRIAVADTHYHRIVLFDSEGNFTGTFGQYGSEPGDFVYPVKITQDPAENLYVCEYGRNDRVQKFRPDGSFVLQFGGPGTEPGQFQRPCGIAWYDHQLFVVDAFNNRIQVFDENGKLVAILGGEDKMTEVSYPYDIAVDHNGDLFVVEYGAGRVSKFSRQGRLLGRYGSSGIGQSAAQFSTPWGLAIDRRNRLYVCDTGNRRIVELEL